MAEALDELLTFIDYTAYWRMTFEERWMGQQVRLKKPFGDLPTPTGGRVLLTAGAVGWIVRLQLDSTTPFVLEFSGFPYRIAPLLEKVEFLD